MSNTKFKEILNIIILSAFAMIIGGYLEAPYYHYLHFPNLYPNDLLSSTLSSGSRNISFFFPILAFISKYADLSIVSFVGHTITLIFFYLGIFYLAKCIFHNSYISYLAVILLMISKGGLIGGVTFASLFIARNIAVVLIIFSIIYFIKSRYLYSFLLLGFAFDIHAVVALAVFGFFIFDLIFKYKKLGITDKKGLLLSLFLFALIISPMFIFYSGSPYSILSSFFSRPDPQWLSIMQVRVPAVISPLTDIPSLVHFTPLLILYIISGIYLLQKRDYLGNLNAHKISLNLLFVFFIYVIITIIFTEIILWETILYLRLVMLSFFIHIFGVIYISYFIYQLYLTALKEKGMTRIINYLLISGFIAATFIYYFRIAWFILIPLAITKIIPQSNKKICYLLYFISFLLVVYSSLYYHIGVRPLCEWLFSLLVIGVRPFWEWLVFWFVALIAIDYIIEHNIITSMTRKYLLSLVLIVFLIFFSAVDMVYHSAKTGRPLFVEAMLTRVNIPHLTPMTYYKDIQLWANKNTSMSDIFLVPIEASPGNEPVSIHGGFRIYSMRPIYGDWMDGALGYFDHGVAIEWYKRMNELGIYSGEDVDKYKLLNETKIKELQRKYNISYAVFEKPKHLNFPIVYENKLFVVYKVM